MKNFVLRVFALLSVLLIQPTAFAADKPTAYRIGVILPLSGPSALWGRSLKNGAEMAAANLPDAVRNTVSLVFEDDHLDAAAAVTAYRKLRDVDAINAVVTFGAASGRAIIPIADKETVLAFAITSDRGVARDAQYGQRIALDPEAQVTPLVAYLKAHGLKRVALLATTQEAMLAYVEAFATSAPGAGLEVVYKRDFAKGETDFRTEASKLKALAPDAVVNSLLPSSLSSFARQLRQVLPNVRTFGFAPAENQGEIDAAQGAMEGLIFSALKMDPDFVASYSKKYAESPQSFAAYTYDVITMIGAARAKGLTSSQEIIASIRALRDFKGACGTYSANAENAFDQVATLLVVANNRPGVLNPQ